MKFSWLLPFHGLNFLPPSAAVLRPTAGKSGGILTVNATQSGPATDSGMHMTTVDLERAAGRQTVLGPC
jgi:hypothetical protein